jgi:hypothetical protein
MVLACCGERTLVGDSVSCRSLVRKLRGLWVPSTCPMGAALPHWYHYGQTLGPLEWPEYAQVSDNGWQ